MNKLFNNIRCRMMAKSAAIMGLIASSIFSANADVPGDNIANSTKSNETVIMQNMDNLQTQNTVQKKLVEKLRDAVRGCIENKGEEALKSADTLKKISKEMVNKYTKVATLTPAQIKNNTAYLQTIAEKIIDAVSGERNLMNKMVVDITNNAQEVKTILNDIFSVQNKAICNLFNNGLNLYASQNNETLLSNIIKSGINVEGLNIDKMIAEAPANADILGYISNALLNSSSKDNNPIEKSRLTKSDIKTSIKALTERLNQADVKNSTDAQNFSNILLTVNYAISADKLADTFDKSIRQASQTILENEKINNAKIQLQFQKDKDQIAYYNAIIQQGKHTIDTNELENFTTQHMSLLNRMSQLASSNDLNTDLALTLINKITQSRTSLNTALSNITDIKSGVQKTGNAIIALNAKTLEEDIIKAQDNVLANILNNGNVNIYKTNGDNPSILSTIIASNAKISGFNLVDAVKNCPNNLESLKSLVEGGYTRTNIKTPAYDFESVNSPNESVDIVSALQEKIEPEVSKIKQEISALQEKIKRAIENGEQKDLQEEKRLLKDLEEKFLPLEDLQENLLLQDQILKEDRGYVKPRPTQSIFSVNNTYNNSDDDDDDYDYDEE